MIVSVSTSTVLTRSKAEVSFYLLTLPALTVDSVIRVSEQRNKQQTTSAAADLRHGIYAVFADSGCGAVRERRGRPSRGEVPV